MENLDHFAQQVKIIWECGFRLRRKNWYLPLGATFSGSDMNFKT
jgi:hypothetical protein